MTKKKKILISIIAVLGAIVLTGVCLMAVAWSGVLSDKLDNENLAYRILQITDVHLRGDKRNNKMFDTIDKLITESEPDYIVVSGDISSNIENERDFRDFAEFIEKYKIEWTFTFGNHDSEAAGDGGWGKPEISAFLQSLEYCSYQDGFVIEEEKNSVYTQGSYGNYTKPIIVGGKLLMSVFLMDSNMYIKDPANGYDGYANFRPEQVEWYKNEVKKIAKEENGDENKVVPSLAFFHIPMQEHIKGKAINGVNMEKSFSSPAPDQMFETMVELGSTKACFFGHDHMNFATTELQGIKMGYGYSMDHTIYLTPQRGGNLFNIKKDGSFSIQGIFRHLGIGELVVTSPF